jgi:hypothetical protein
MLHNDDKKNEDMIYFATDGSYGDAAGLIIVDTSQWNEEEWAIIDEARDSERVRLAYELSTDTPDQPALPGLEEEEEEI